MQTTETIQMWAGFEVSGGLVALLNPELKRLGNLCVFIRSHQFVIISIITPHFSIKSLQATVCSNDLKLDHVLDPSHMILIYMLPKAINVLQFICLVH